MAMTDTNKLDLDELFLQARDLAPEPHAALYARVLRDAQLSQNPGRTSFWRNLWGRWGTVGGLVAAAITGVCIGVVLPENVGNMLGRDVEQTTVADGAAQRTIILPDSDILALAGE